MMLPPEASTVLWLKMPPPLPAVALALASLATEHQHIAWTAKLVGALVWLVVVLSLGAILLLMVLLRRGTASSVSSLLYLVPPVTALLAVPLLHQRMSPSLLVGMAVSGVGVVLATRRQGPIERSQAGSA